MNTILLHTCCACCASYVIPHLQDRYIVKTLFFNPNIQPEEEYNIRLEEMKLVAKRFGADLEYGEYRPELWDEAVSPYRHLPEKSRRCWECYGLRMEETARRASGMGMDIFTTTLSVSPHKVYRKILETGRMAAEKYGVRFHDGDFKKRDGFKLSVEKSRELGLTRQDYCGCILSLKEAEERRNRE
ncbi:MAG: epoxyqueuosine reductase QueH [Candidatus Krumholzibacteriales bacterium]